jgi:hypothetical protein
MPIKQLFTDYLDCKRISGNEFRITPAADFHSISKSSEFFIILTSVLYVITQNYYECKGSKKINSEMKSAD